MRTCKECNIEKDLQRFPTKDYKTGRKSYTCNSCYYNKRKKDPDFVYRQKMAAIKSLYGLTPEEYENLLDKQNGLCGICMSSGVRLAVDHDHVTKQVRGLLCHTCNTGLGKLGDNIEGIERALNYLNSPIYKYPI